MFDPARRLKGAAPGKDLSPALLACAPYMLARLPAAFVFRGRVQSGVKWVYPRPEAHGPERYFAPGMQLLRVQELKPEDRSDEPAEGRWHLQPFASLPAPLPPSCTCRMLPHTGTRQDLAVQVWGSMRVLNKTEVEGGRRRRGAAASRARSHPLCGMVGCRV